MWWDVSRLRPYVMFVLLDFVLSERLVVSSSHHHSSCIFSSSEDRHEREVIRVYAGRYDCPFDSCCNKKYMNDQSLLQKPFYDHYFVNVVLF